MPANSKSLDWPKPNLVIAPPTLLGAPLPDTGVTLTWWALALEVPVQPDLIQRELFTLP
jgi:hypothetical protein